MIFIKIEITSYKTLLAISEIESITSGNRPNNFSINLLLKFSK